MEKENECFKVQSADDCVWLTDKRKNTSMHLTKSQAKELSAMLAPKGE